MEDSSKLEYQAGQEEDSKADSKDKPQPEPQEKKDQPDADRDKDRGQEGDEEGGVNEDVQDKYEDSHFAPPTAPEQVRLLWPVVDLACWSMLMLNGVVRLPGQIVAHTHQESSVCVCKGEIDLSAATHA